MKINKEKINQIRDLVENGFLQHEACKEAGVDLKTIEDWKEKKKKKAKPDILDRAENLFKSRLIQIILSESLKSKNYRASMLFLSHKYPEEFGPKTTKQKRFDDRLYSRTGFNKKNYKQILDDSKNNWKEAAYILIDRYPDEFRRIRGRKI